MDNKSLVLLSGSSVRGESCVEEDNDEAIFLSIHRYGQSMDLTLTRRSGEVPSMSTLTHRS